MCLGLLTLCCSLYYAEPSHIFSHITSGNPFVACIDETLASKEWVRRNVLSMVLRDDLAPRVSVTNVVQLAKEIDSRENMIAISYNEDVQAFYSRMKTLWAPPSRSTKLWSKNHLSTTADATDVSAARDAPAATSDGHARSSGEPNLPTAGPSAQGHTSVGEHGGTPANGAQSVSPWKAGAAPTGTALYPTTSLTPGAPIVPPAAHVPAVAAAAVPPRATPAPLTRTAGRPTEPQTWLAPAIVERLPLWAQWRARQPTTPPIHPPFDPATHPLDPQAAPPQSWGPAESEVVDDVAERAAQSFIRAGAAEAALELGGDAHEADYVDVKREDITTRRMVPGGRVLHLYNYRGLYRASLVNHTFRPLRRIELYGNTIPDHTMDSMADALRSVKAGRRASKEPPQWMSMSDERAR